ncbi:MAG: hypothetical protein AAF266_06630 [Planctomycetota bacterium]
MPTALEDKLRAVAEEHLNPLLERRKALREELAGVEAEIDAAEKAIAGAASGGTAGKSSGKRKRSAQKASAPRDHVVEVATKLLDKEGGKTGRKELLELCKEHLREEGFGLTGLMQRFNKIMDEEPRFVCRGNSVSLSAAHK